MLLMFADGFILASPTNFYSATGLFKRFMERLVVYAYWPWGQPAPVTRKGRNRRAVVIVASRAPGFLGRLFVTLKELRVMGQTSGAEPVGTVFVDLILQEERLPQRPPGAGGPWLGNGPDPGRVRRGSGISRRRARLRAGPRPG